MLGKMFALQIDAALSGQRHLCVYQTRSKRIKTLKELGLVEEIEERVGHDQFAVTVKGWGLTAFGHMTYCLSCD